MMSLFRKKTLRIIMIVIALFILVNLITTQPIKFYKTFDNSFVTTDLKTKSEYDKKCDLFGCNLGEDTNNVLFREVTETTTSTYPEFIL
jgi:hypothetical protein